MPPRRPAARSPGASYSALWIKRARRSKAEIDDIKSVLRNDQPMMVRAGLCQLVARATTEKTEAQYHQTVIRLLTEMRLEGEIRFSWIIDESRRTRETQTFDSVADAVRDTAKFYRRSALRECSDYVENLVGERSNSVTPFAGLSAGTLGAGVLVTFAPAPEQLVFIVLLVASVIEAAILWYMPETAELRRGRGRIGPRRDATSPRSASGGSRSRPEVF